MSDLASACPVAEFDALSRIDPYWSGMWDRGSAASWYARPRTEMRLDSGLLGSFPRQFLHDPDAALARFLLPQNRVEAISMLGVLHSWRTATAEQVACFTGSRRFLAPYNQPSADAISAHLLDVGIAADEPATGRFKKRTVLLRPSRSDVFEERVMPRLSWGDWLSVTGGQDWDPGGQYDRHNVLATELALRAAEYADVATVWGERFCSVDLLTGRGAGLEPIDGDQRTADACLVRNDGLRLVIEMTANQNHSFEKKVNRWARLLAERPLAETGVMVEVVRGGVVGVRRQPQVTVAVERGEGGLHARLGEHPVAQRVAPELPGDQTVRETHQPDGTDRHPDPGPAIDAEGLGHRRGQQPCAQSASSVV